MLYISILTCVNFYTHFLLNKLLTKPFLTEKIRIFSDKKTK